MDIVIYDEEHDKHVHITLMDALLASGVNEAVEDFFDVEGLDTDDERVMMAMQAKGGPPTATEAVTLIKNTLGMSKMGKPETAKNIVAKVAAGQWLPLELVIARPFIEHLMMSAVMTVAGRDTGATCQQTVPTNYCANPNPNPNPDQAQPCLGRLTCRSQLTPL
tara:strand:- start:273 stop:764 length:492 start_codon:yes stop_codon:yes gene_type:complete